MKIYLYKLDPMDIFELISFEQFIKATIRGVKRKSPDFNFFNTLYTLDRVIMFLMFALGESPNFGRTITAGPYLFFLPHLSHTDRPYEMETRVGAVWSIAEEDDEDGVTFVASQVPLPWFGEPNKEFEVTKHNC
jgi:hypothetical protein